MATQVHHLTPLKRLILFPMRLLLRLWRLTLRVDISQDARELLAPSKGPALLLLWHNQLFYALQASPYLGKLGSLTALVSASRDGAWLSELLRENGIEPIRGSSSFRSSSVLRALIQAAQSGKRLVITPDGPKGPAHTLKEGLWLIAAKAKVPFILIRFECTRKWTLASWDRFELPKPFSRLTLRVRLIEPDTDASAAQLKQRYQDSVVQALGV